MNARESAQLALRCRPDGEVVAVLTDAGALLGKTPVGHRLSELVDRKSADKCERFVQTACQNGGAFNWDLNLCQQGTAHGLCFAALRRDDGHLLVVAAHAPGDHAQAARRLADAVRREDEPARAGHGISTWDPLEEISRANNALVRLQRALVKRNAELVSLTEERDRLLGILAHDLRGPVAIIQGYCELLNVKGHHVVGPFQKKCVEKIQTACARLTELLEHTLHSAHESATRLSATRAMVDVVELVRDDVEIHRVIASRKNIELSMVCKEPIPRTRLDPTGIHQVVSNLLSNAIKYSHRDSKVTVAIARVEGELQITVQDRGQGIPADELAQSVRALPGHQRAAHRGRDQHRPRPLHRARRRRGPRRPRPRRVHGRLPAPRSSCGCPSIRRASSAPTCPEPSDQRSVTQEKPERMIQADSFAARYLDRLLAFDQEGALAEVRRVLDAGTSLRSLYLDGFEPVQHELGRLWERNLISVAHEHYCTAITQLALAETYPRFVRPSHGAPRMIVTCVPGELHELGGRMVADFFELEGWDATYLGEPARLDDVLSALSKRARCCSASR